MTNLHEFDEVEFTDIPDTKAIPLSLEYRAKRALVELETVKHLFAKYQGDWEAMKKARQESFEVAYNHYEDTKDKFKRIEMPDGQVLWLDLDKLASSIGNEPLGQSTTHYVDDKTLSVLKSKNEWPFGDTSEWA